MLYFGYGANKDSDMIEAIVGRVPSGFPAVLKDHELCVQEWNEVPPNVQQELRGSWADVEGFETYFIRPKVGSEVTGTVWNITEDERKYINEWEMNDGFWYKEITMTGVYDTSGKEYEVSTEIILDITTGHPVSGEEGYPPFLNKKEKMLEIATGLRNRLAVKDED